MGAVLVDGTSKFRGGMTRGRFIQGGGATTFGPDATFAGGATTCCDATVGGTGTLTMFGGRICLNPIGATFGPAPFPFNKCGGGGYNGGRRVCS